MIFMKKIYLMTIYLLGTSLVSGCNVGAQSDQNTDTQSGLLTADSNGSSGATKPFTSDEALALAKSALEMKMADPLSSYTPQSANSTRSVNQNRQALASSNSNASNNNVHAQLFENLLNAKVNPEEISTTKQARASVGENIFFQYYGSQKTTNCKVSGTMTVNILDFNRNGKLDVNEKGEESYSNCNDGNNMLNGIYEVDLKIAELDPVTGEYTNLKATFTYTNFIIANLQSKITYNGSFYGQVINDNSRYLKRYADYGLEFSMVNSNDGSSFIFNKFFLETLWYDKSYGQANLAFDQKNPPLANYLKIDDIPTNVNLAGSVSDPALLANTFKVDQDYSYRTTDINNGADVVTVTSFIPFEGQLNKNPTKGELRINKPGALTKVEVSQDSVLISSGVDFYSETKTYTWKDFNSLIGAVFQ